MRNRTVQESESSRIQPKSPFDYPGEEWEKCTLSCARCKKKLVKFPFDVSEGERMWNVRIPPIIERAIHMHQCQGSLVSRLIASNFPHEDQGEAENRDEEIRDAPSGIPGAEA